MVTFFVFHQKSPEMNIKMRTRSNEIISQIFFPLYLLIITISHAGDNFLLNLNVKQFKIPSSLFFFTSKPNKKQWYDKICCYHCNFLLNFSSMQQLRALIWQFQHQRIINMTYACSINFIQKIYVKKHKSHVGVCYM